MERCWWFLRIPIATYTSTIMQSLVTAFSSVLSSNIRYPPYRLKINFHIYHKIFCSFLSAEDLEVPSLQAPDTGHVLILYFFSKTTYLLYMWWCQAAITIYTLGISFWEIILIKCLFLFYFCIWIHSTYGKYVQLFNTNLDFFFFALAFAFAHLQIIIGYDRLIAWYIFTNSY